MFFFVFFLRWVLGAERHSRWARSFYRFMLTWLSLLLAIAIAVIIVVALVTGHWKN